MYYLNRVVAIIKELSDFCNVFWGILLDENTLLKSF